VKLLIGGSPCTYWRPFPGYEGYYEISNHGDVKRLDTGKLISRKVEKNGYVRVHLSKNGKAESILLHRAVALAFVPNRNPKAFKTVNHIDENKQNNSASNLEWCDMSYQNRYGRGAETRNEAKKRAVIQLDMDGEFVKKWGSIKEAAESLGLNSSSIMCVCKGARRYKSTGGCKFRYVEGGDAT
jgi:hypothetical protein